uniref:Uncharacterized protein n=1 Tax=uncultured prokaryote TaxID=198431 RepID=A0A0H5Q5S6_9ZZZZ|nr:hypothetical protein [uncultured prokaryote]
MDAAQEAKRRDRKRQLVNVAGAELRRKKLRAKDAGRRDEFSERLKDVKGKKLKASAAKVRQKRKPKAEAGPPQSGDRQEQKLLPDFRGHQREVDGRLGGGAV